MPSFAETLTNLLARGQPAAPALTAPDAEPLSFAALRAQQVELAAQLGGLGLGAEDRIAIVLPNGPAMASCFLAVAAVATAAPLNPLYRDNEFDFYLGDLDARALVVAAGATTPAHDVAVRRGVPLIELETPNGAPAGTITLRASRSAGTRPVPIAGTDSTALILHTSGTTSRPKMVPLSQANLCASAGHIGTALGLSSNDRCLNIMPLFHIHGLVAAVLASLAAGGTVCCSPGFNAMRFFAWLDETAPSWYTAVPTMHQAILERASRNAQSVARAGLRFIRSSSSSLPPAVMQALERTFDCPVIESYGMTEAAHQMTSNRLPPGARKAGTVGVAAGPEVRLMDATGHFVATGLEGEVVIRGPNVTAGYAANPAANVNAFAADPDGLGAPWFRTGDQGVFDADGYLTISGRLKEIINRGGEKVAPREVDDVLQEHPAVQQVVTFALPHPKLGEEVAAAIVLAAGHEVSEQALRDFALTRLAAFKVPRTILFLTEIPQGATGKPQRIGLAEKLGLV